MCVCRFAFFFYSERDDVPQYYFWDYFPFSITIHSIEAKKESDSGFMYSRIQKHFLLPMPLTLTHMPLKKGSGRKWSLYYHLRIFHFHLIRYPRKNSEDWVRGSSTPHQLSSDIMDKKRFERALKGAWMCVWAVL